MELQLTLSWTKNTVSHYMKYHKQVKDTVTPDVLMVKEQCKILYDVFKKGEK